MGRRGISLWLMFSQFLIGRRRLKHCRRIRCCHPFVLEFGVRAKNASRIIEADDGIVRCVSVRAIQLHASWAAGRGRDSPVDHGRLRVGAWVEESLVSWRERETGESLGGYAGSSLVNT